MTTRYARPFVAAALVALATTLVVGLMPGTAWAPRVFLTGGPPCQTIPEDPNTRPETGQFEGAITLRGFSNADGVLIMDGLAVGTCGLESEQNISVNESFSLPVTSYKGNCDRFDFSGSQVELTGVEIDLSGVAFELTGEDDKDLCKAAALVDGPSADGSAASRLTKFLGANPDQA